MDWNNLPDDTLVVRLAPDKSFDATLAIMKDMFVFAKQHGLSIITSTQVRERKMNTKFVTVPQYMEFVSRYDKNPDKQWYRFGQAFYNEMVWPVLRADGMPDHSHPELFHCQDQKKAEAIIFDTYVIIPNLQLGSGS